MNEYLYPACPVLTIANKSTYELFENKLKACGISNIITCTHSDQILSILSAQRCEVIFLEFNSHHDCSNLFSQLVKGYPDIPIILMVSEERQLLGFSTLKNGVFDVLVNPIEETRLLNTFRHAMMAHEWRRINQHLKQQIISETGDYPAAFHDFITINKKILSLFKYAVSICESTHPILITGEPGTGKELFAKGIHNLCNIDGKFVVMNLRRISDSRFSQELFGVKSDSQFNRNKKGLLELAKGGTLFLDEIGYLGVNSQKKLWHLLKEHEGLFSQSNPLTNYNVRVIASSQRDIGMLEHNGMFRKDLSYFLQTHHIHIPSLMERMDDIPLLVDFFLTQAASHMKKKKPTAPKELFTLLQTYHFPKNVKELKEMVFEATKHHESGILSQSEFKSYIAQARKKNVAPYRKTISIDLNPPVLFSKNLPTLKQTTGMLILEAMKRAEGNQSIASQMLGISQQALSKRLKNMPKSKYA